MPLTLVKMAVKIYCFVKCSNFWHILYYTRNTLTDFERSLWILYLRYWYHSSFIVCIIAIQELLSHLEPFASPSCELKQNYRGGTGVGLGGQTKFQKPDWKMKIDRPKPEKNKH